MGSVGSSKFKGDDGESELTHHVRHKEQSGR